MVLDIEEIQELREELTKGLIGEPDTECFDETDDEDCLPEQDDEP